jgi:hypothetical protein
MDDIELGRHAGVAMRDAFSDDAAADLNWSGPGIRAQHTVGGRRAMVVVSVAACAALVIAAVVFVQIVRSRHGTGAQVRPGATPTTIGPTATAPSWARDRLDQLTFRYPSDWRTVPPGGPPTPGLANVVQYLTTAAVVQGCAARETGTRSPRRCSEPVRTLRAGQVLVWIVEGGGFVWPSGAPTRVIRGHRQSLQFGKVTSFASAAADCPTGATNYLQLTVDDQAAGGEPSPPRQSSFTGYGIYACINSPTMTTPATVKHLVDTVRISQG